ncbi:TIGR03915 family putative DNA repair protein [Enterococcus sp. BWB1-3]|uniref:TIGR03915 family putative DNA repair protein n=1 Tax=Enterococcus sp. BWB1-3 TaxID=2787713 RepID=UPI001922777F|nr:TIGR03915 family putative DNA repair protein [Enterococcus sp. BWB1-3]MBL1230088.1 TIGR03915 family putative DNA repair protein [Enterococcus sp. BWB1-3]
MSIERTTATWEYDGSFAGFLTIVDRAFRKKQFPGIILTPETAMESLFISDWIDTNVTLAEKIVNRLQQRLTSENFRFIHDGFYATMDNKELHLLEALAIALDTRDSLKNFIGHPSVLAIDKGLKSLFGEVHLYTGFVRFEYAGELLFSKITPKHFSLPYICPHFAERYPLESIMIYDTTHRLLALIDKGTISFIENTDCPEFNNAQTKEGTIQKQWTAFLESVTIQERVNKKTQMSHLPLRFRENMVEFYQTDKLSSKNSSALFWKDAKEKL